MLDAGRRQTGVVLGAGPVGEQLGPQRPQLDEGDLLRFVGGGPARERGIHQIGEEVEPCGRVRACREAGVQGRARERVRSVFIIHERLY